MSQKVEVQTTPPGALVTWGSEIPVYAPTTLRVPRKPSFAIARAEKPGHHPTCRLVAAPANPWLTTLDAIPAAIPLIVDGPTGALHRYPKRVHLTLHPVAPGETADRLPSNEALLTAWLRERRDVCAAYELNPGVVRPDVHDIVQPERVIPQQR